MPREEVERVLSYVTANVRRLRVRAGLTQEQLAEAAGVNQTYLQKIERGTGNPSAKVLIKLAFALAVPPARLFAKAAPTVRRSGRPHRKA